MPAFLSEELAVAPRQTLSAQEKTSRLERSIRSPTKSQMSLSPRSVSAIDLEITSSHEAARITDAEDSRTPVLLRYTQLAQHVLRRPIASTLGVLFE